MYTETKSSSGKQESAPESKSSCAEGVLVYEAIDWPCLAALSTTRPDTVYDQEADSNKGLDIIYG